MGTRVWAVRTMAFLAAIVLATTAASEADQLFTNGAVTSIPGGGPGGTHASRLQTSIGMTSLGYNIDFADGSPSALADDFKVTGPGWQITRLTFYAYQTSSGTTSTLKDLRFVIFNGRPDLPGSTIVAGNPAVNALSSTSFTNIYRDSQQFQSVNFRPIMRAVANVNISLPPGEYWMVWAIAGTMADGPWAPPLTIPNQPITGNGLHLCTCNNGWGPARDTGTRAQQGFPFEIEGTTLNAPSLTVASSKPTLRFGDRLTLVATLAPGGGSGPVDAYVLLDIPGGGTVSLTLSGPMPGVVPLARGFVPFNFSGPLLDVTLPPIPLGTYVVRSMLTLPGTTTPISSNSTSFTVQ